MGNRTVLTPALATTLASAMLIALFGLAGPAAAEGNCPPGQYPIGGGNAGWQGCAPIPGAGGGGGGGPPPVQMRWIDNYYAAAWHRESSDAWISAGYHNKGRAESAALAACNRVMGGGCTLATSNVNGAVVIARGVEGGLYVADSAKKGDAEKNVKEYCRKQGDECTVINWVTVKPGQAPVGQSVMENSTVYEPRGNARRRYGAIAWVDPERRGARPWQADVWFAGGRGSAEQASADALALCQKDMPTPCRTALTGADVYIAVVERDGNWMTASSGPTVELAGQRAMTECKKAKGKCRIATTLDLTRDEAYRFDPLAQGQPYFAAQAWIKGNVAPWQNSVWSVSGGKDAEGVKRAALAACKKESKQECEVAAQAFNGRIALYIDQTGYIRASVLERDADPAAVVAKKCAEAKVTCKLVKVADARVPLTERIEVR